MRQDISERKRTEEALRVSEERYALAMEAAADGHMDWNFLTGEFYISPRMLQIVGHPPDATFADRADWVARFPFHPEDRKRWETAIAAHFAGREAIFKMDLRIVVNGETRWLAFNFIATRDAAGKVVRWTGSITDLTDTKRDVATVVQSIPGLVAILTPAGEVDAVNDQLAEYCGQPLEAMKQWGTNGTVHAEDLPHVTEIFMRGISTGEPYELEARVRRFDGVYRWNQIRGHPSRDSDGRIVRWYSVIFDIDDRKRAEEALRESQERYERVMLASEAGFWDWDVPVDKFYASPRLLEMTGFPPGTEFASRSDFSARAPFYPGDWAKWESAVKELFASGGTRLTGELRTVHGAEIRWYALSGMCVRDAAGKVQRWTGSATYITEEKRAKEALRLSEERYALAMEASEEGHFDWNVRTDEIFASEHMKKLLALPTDFEYRTRGDMVARIPFCPGESERIAQMAREVLAGSALLHEFEYRLQRLEEKEPRWIHARWKIFRDAAGVAQRVIGVVNDITERKRAEEAMRESEARFRGLTALSSDWYWQQDEQMRFTYSTAAQDPRPPGHPGGSSIGKKRWELPGIVPISSSWPEHQELLAAREPFRDFEYSRPAADGTLRYISVSGAPTFDAEGKFRGYHGVGRDVTPRKLAEEVLLTREEELQRSETHLAEAQRVSHTGSWAWSPTFEVRYWSEECYRIQGFDPARGLPSFESFVERIHSEDRPAFVQGLDKAVRAKMDFEREYRIVHPDGAIRCIHSLAHPVLSPAGNLIEYVGTVMDVTERRLAEAERSRLEERLQQGEKMEAIGRFASGIVHDFSNILGGILAYGEMLFDDAAENTPRKRYAQNVLTAANRGRDLVDQILQYTRSQRGRHKLTDICTTVAETLELVRSSLPARITLCPAIPDAPLVMMGNATQLHQVVMNLCSNAIHAMKAGGPLRVGVTPIEMDAVLALSHGKLLPGSYVRVSVEDTGCGMDEATVGRIFEPFFTTKEFGHGTGLGLALVYAIVTDFKGSIDVKSVPDEGSTFSIYLPSAEAPATIAA